MRFTGAQIILQTLAKLGLKNIFAFNDSSLKWLFAEKDQAKSLNFTFAVKPENTIYMAQGFARTSGLPSVVIVPAGSGSTQILSGLAAAYLDSLPIICITGQVHSSVLGTDAFQEVDTISMTQTCSKHNYLVKNVTDLQRILVEAHFLATTGRPGPIVINLPIDLLEQLTEVPKDLPIAKLKGYKLVEKGHIGQIKKALDLILQSQKPVIYCGGGAVLNRAEKDLVHFAESLQIPVAQTLTGISAFPGNHPLNLGLVGRGGSAASNMTANSADLLICIGTRFNPHVLGQIHGFKVTSKVIHIDIDPSAIAKNTHVDVPIVGDAKDALIQILNLAKDRKSELKLLRDALKPWHQQILAWQKEYHNPADEKTFNIKNIMQSLSRITNHDAIITCSDENLSLRIAQNYAFSHEGHWCPTGGIEVFGFALAAAIGAQKANPQKTIFAVMSLKYLVMNPAELLTLQYEKLPIRIILLQNEGEKYIPVGIKLEEWIQAYGLGYSHCEQLKTFESQIKKHQASQKAYVFDCENPTSI